MSCENIRLTHVLKISVMFVVSIVFLVGAVNAVDDRLDLLEYKSETTHDILTDMRDDLDYIRNRLDQGEY